MEIRVYNNDIEAALKRLKRIVFDEGIIREVMRRRAYEKPSEKKNRKRRESTARARKEARLRNSF